MPVLTTVDEIQITFAAKAVSMLTDHDASTGQAVTCVYGLGRGVLHIEEAVPTFIKRISMTKSFALLTRPNKSPVWINAGSVSSVRAPLPGEYVGGVNAVIAVGAMFQGVMETPRDAVAQINSCGGSL